MAAAEWGSREGAGGDRKERGSANREVCVCVCMCVFLHICSSYREGLWGSDATLVCQSEGEWSLFPALDSLPTPVLSRPPSHEGLCHSGLHAGILHPGVVPFLKNGEMLNPKGIESFKVHHTMIVRELSSPAYFTLFTDFNKVRHTGYQNRRFNVRPLLTDNIQKTTKLSIFHRRRPHSSVLVGSRAVVES